MSYSLAIFLILIFLGIIAVLALTNHSGGVSTQVPSTCYITAQLKCTQFVVTSTHTGSEAILFFVNNLGQNLSMPAGSFIVKPAITNATYVGSCYPVNAAPGTPVTCVASSTYKPSLGSQLNIAFQLEYNNFHVTGTSTAYASPNATTYSVLLLSSIKGGGISVNNFRYANGSTVIFVKGVNYNIAAEPPIKYAFQNWAQSGGVSIPASGLNSTQTTANATANGTIKAVYVVSATSSTIPITTSSTVSTTTSPTTTTIPTTTIISSTSSTSSSSSTSSTTTIPPVLLSFFCFGGVNSSGTQTNISFGTQPANNGNITNWTKQVNPIPFTNDAGRCLTYNGYIYCLQETNSNATYYSSVLPNSTIGSWTSSTPRPAINANGSDWEPGCVIYSGYIYCIGGTVPNYDHFSTYLAYSNATYSAPVSSSGIGAWTKQTKFPIRWGFGECVNSTQGYIYCIGGVTANKSYGCCHFMNDTYYAKLTNGNIGAWQHSANNIPINENYNTCNYANGYIYCVGGETVTTGSGVYWQPPPACAPGGCYYADSQKTYYAKVLSNGDVGQWQLSTIYPYNFTGQRCIADNNYMYCITQPNVFTGYNGTVFYAQLSSGGIGTWNQTKRYPQNITSQTCVVPS
ncbi:MAG: hypothetical protein KGH72_04715 [Candidatus Micrarchaeota archaeon]|nr:hypothetical protein [Candidatus Micrarchaeota archaeon]